MCIYGCDTGCEAALHCVSCLSRLVALLKSGLDLVLALREQA